MKVNFNARQTDSIKQQSPVYKDDNNELPHSKLRGIAIEKNAVILRLDRRIQCLFLDCPIKSGNDRLTPMLSIEEFF